MVQHKGHDIVELKDQAEGARKLTREGIEKAKKHIDGWDGLIEDVDRAKVSVNREMEKALVNVQETRDEFTEIIERLTLVMNETTKKQINEIKTTKANSIKTLNKKKKNVQDKKNGIERQIEEMERQLKMDNPSEVIHLSKETSKELEKMLRDSAHVNDNVIVAKVPAFIKPHLSSQLRFEDYGAASEKTLQIGRPPKRAVSLQWAPLGFKSWTTSQIAVSEDGLVIVYGMKLDGTIVLKLFNKEQREIWEKEPLQDIVGYITGMAFIQSGWENYIIISDNQSNLIHVRAVSDGTIVGQAKIPHSRGKICFDSFGQGYIRNIDTAQIKKLHVHSDVVSGLPEITVDHYNSIPFSLDSPHGFCLVHSNIGKKMFIMSSWRNSTIQAIDAENGKVIWEVTGEYEGQKICPCGMCTNEKGNIYVADGSNARVLQLSCTGQIERCLFETKGSVINVQWLEMKLLVYHRDGDQEAITVYEM